MASSSSKTPSGKPAAGMFSAITTCSKISRHKDRETLESLTTLWTNRTWRRPPGASKNPRASGFCQGFDRLGVEATKMPISSHRPIEGRLIEWAWVGGARDRNRTGTDLSALGILSPVRLPVSPPGQIVFFSFLAYHWQELESDCAQLVPCHDLCLKSFLEAGYRPPCPSGSRCCIGKRLLS